MLALPAALLGLIIGSFLNVFVLRRGVMPLSGRSGCFSCGSQIRWYDNIPVLSWLLLRGRCRSCKSRISAQYPLVEIATAVLFGLAANAIAPNIFVIDALNAATLALSGFLIALLIAIAVYDMRHTIIPDTWAYTAALCALIVSVLERPEGALMSLLAGPVVALPLFALWFVSKGRWMGLGDSKLALSIGFLLGPLYGLVALMYAFIVGAIVSVFVLLPLPYVLAFAHRQGIMRWRGTAERFTMKSEVGFGPFLVAAFFLVWFALLYNIPLPL